MLIQLQISKQQVSEKFHSKIVAGAAAGTPPSTLSSSWKNFYSDQFQKLKSCIQKVTWENISKILEEPKVKVLLFQNVSFACIMCITVYVV